MKKATQFKLKDCLQYKYDAKRSTLEGEGWGYLIKESSTKAVDKEKAWLILSIHGHTLWKPHL